MARARILIADDHTLVAEAIQKLLEPAFKVIQTVSDGRALLSAASAARPDLILIDLNMPLLNGLDAGTQLKQSMPEVKLIVLTMNEDPEIACEALRSWASGYVLKKSAGAELLEAVRTVLNGGKYVAPSLRDAVQEAMIRTQKTAELRTLTPRQREVLQLLAEGHTMKEVASILNVAARTVAFHKYRIMQEFQLNNNSELLHFAIKLRLIQREP